MKTALLVPAVLLLAARPAVPFQIATDSAARAVMQTLCGVDSIAGVIPANLSLKAGGSWNVAAIAMASERIQRLQGRKFMLRGKVEFLQECEGGFRIKLPDGQLTQAGDDFGYRVWAYFDAAAARKLAKIAPGEQVILTGTLRRADLRLYEGDRWPALSIDLANTEVFVDPEGL